MNLPVCLVDTIHGGGRRMVADPTLFKSPRNRRRRGPWRTWAWTIPPVTMAVLLISGCAGDSTANPTPSPTVSIEPSLTPKPATSTPDAPSPTPVAPTRVPPAATPESCGPYPKFAPTIVTGSPEATKSRLAIDMLRPQLPHIIRGFVTSAGESVDIAIGIPQSRLPASETLEIDPAGLRHDATPSHIQSLRDAAAEAFRWITAQGACVGDLYVYWRSGGGGTGAQSEFFHEWLEPSDRFPDVTCNSNICQFVQQPGRSPTPEEALFNAAGTASFNWKGACAPPDGSALAIYEVCFRFEEQRGDTIKYTVMINQPPNRGGPRLDAFVVYVRQFADGWKQVEVGLCQGECPWPS